MGSSETGRDQRQPGQTQRNADNLAGNEPAQPDYRPIRGNGRLDLLA